MAVVPATLPMNVRRTERAASSRIALLLRIEGPLECRIDLGSRGPLIALLRRCATTFTN
jgi:hypothetical protein